MLSDVIVDRTTSVKDQVVSGENGSVTYTFSNVTSEHTITAMFEPMSYTVTYNANEGTNVPSAQTKLANEELVLAGVPTRNKYEFRGWGLSANATEVTYEVGDKYINNENITLYALWKAELSDVSTIGQYVEYIPTSTSYETDTTKTGYTSIQEFNPSITQLWRIIENDGISITLTSAEIVKDNSGNGLSLVGNTGYTNVAAILTGIASEYENSNYSVSSSYPTDEIDLEETLDQVGYWLNKTSGNAISGKKVSYVNNVDEKPTEILYSISNSNIATHGIRPQVTLKDNIVFVSGDGTKENPYKLSSTETVTKYEITVTQTNGGNISPDTTNVVIGSGQSFIITANEGYNIQSVTVDQNSIDITNNSTMTYTFDNVQSTHTITATFSPIIYTISYELDGGTNNANNLTSYTTEYESFTLSEPTKEYYEFLGWTGSNGNTPQKEVEISKGSTGNKNYIANWKELQEFELTTALTEGLKYIICSNNNALTNSSGSIGSSTVEPVDNKIRTNDSTIMWRYNGSNFVNESTGESYSLYAAPGNRGSASLELSTSSASTVSYANSQLMLSNTTTNSNSGTSNRPGGSDNTSSTSTFYLSSNFSAVQDASQAGTITLYKESGVDIAISTLNGKNTDMGEITVNVKGILFGENGNIKYDLYVGEELKASVTEASGTAVSLVADGLEKETRYNWYVKLTAVNDETITIESEVFTIVTSNGFEKTTISATTESTTQLNVTASATLTSGTGNVKYDLYIDGTYNSSKTSPSGQSVTFNVTELTRGTSYTCKVIFTSVANELITDSKSTSRSTYTCNGDEYSNCLGMKSVEIEEKCGSSEEYSIGTSTSSCQDTSGCTITTKIYYCKVADCGYKRQINTHSKCSGRDTDEETKHTGTVTTTEYVCETHGNAQFSSYTTKHCEHGYTYAH